MVLSPPLNTVVWSAQFVTRQDQESILRKVCPSNSAPFGTVESIVQRVVKFSINRNTCRQQLRSVLAWWTKNRLARRG